MENDLAPPLPSARQTRCYRPQQFTAVMGTWETDEGNWLLIQHDTTAFTCKCGDLTNTSYEFIHISLATDWISAQGFHQQNTCD